MNRYSKSLIEQVKQDRLSGLGLTLVARKYGIPKTTVYYWIQRQWLPPKTREQLARNTERARAMGRAVMAKRRAAELEEIKKEAGSVVNLLEVTKGWAKVLCSFLYWAEGGKKTSSMTFINSDPVMIETFLVLLLYRKAFKLDEKKFRVVVHLHEYHDGEGVIAYWSKITKIPLSQFTKPYLKQNSGKNIKLGYKGCIQIKYYDAKIAKEMYWLYTTLHDTLVT